MKKVVRLNENDLMKIVKKVISEQNWYQQEPVGKQIAKIKPGPGGKYCFDPKRYLSETDQVVHLIKQGDSLDRLSRIGSGMDNIIKQNNLCPLNKGLRAGDVIIYSMAPSGR